MTSTDQMSITPAFRDGLRRVWSSPALMVLLAVLFPMVGVTGIFFGFGQGIVSVYPALFVVLVVYSIIRAWCTGGILHRYAQNRPMRAGAFQRVCGTFFFRLLRLHLLSALILGGGVTQGQLLILHFYLQSNPGVLAFWVGLVTLVLLGLGYIFCDVVLDYAKIRTVVEDRRSMVFAVTAGFRFAVRRPGAVVRLYLLNGAIAVILLGIHWVAIIYSLHAESWLLQQHWGTVLFFSALGIVPLVWVPLLFLATQTAFFQDELAYPGYTAGSGVSPPDLPVTEVVAGPPTDGV